MENDIVQGFLDFHEQMLSSEEYASLKIQCLRIRAIAKPLGASPSYIHKALQGPR